MGRARVRIRNAGLQEVKRSLETRRVVQEAAEAVAENVRSQDITVGDREGGADEIPLPVVTKHSADLNGAISHVVLAHPAGQAVQAKHGSLTKAAAQVGLKVRRDG